jgi:acetyl-CoA synthetase
VTLAGGHEPTRATALAIMRFAREQLAPYKRIRRLELGALPNTISGKIRRVELRGEEDARHPADAAPGGRAEHAFWEEDFPEVKA